MSRNRYYLHGSCASKAIVIGIKRLWDNYFIAWIQTSEKPKHDRLTSSSSYNYLVITDMYTRLFIIIDQFAAVTFITGTMAILQHFYICMPNSVQDSRW